MKKEYDFIIVGAGISGLVLALNLYEHYGSNKSILLIDKNKPSLKYRNIAFWSQKNHKFKEIFHRSWDKLRVRGTKNFQKIFHLQKYRYNLIKGEEFYNYAISILEKSENFQFVQQDVKTIDLDGIVDSKYYARFVFDSRFDINDFKVDKHKYRFLRQYFCGWEIESDNESFNPDIPTFMDFNVDQDQCITFFYVLPITKKKALIECVQIDKKINENIIQKYISKKYNLVESKIKFKECGVTPLTDMLFSRINGRIIKIGISGGLIKPSTGYGFKNILNDSDRILNNLNNIKNLSKINRFYRICDSIFLYLMKKDPDNSYKLFVNLFKKIDIEFLFKFLDEELTYMEKIMFLLKLFDLKFFKPLIKIQIGYWKDLILNN